MTIRGSVDSLSAEGASGWAIGSPGRPLVVQAVLDGQVIGETLAEQERHDLLAAGLGDGRCGFALAFHDAPLDVELLAFVSIRPPALIYGFDAMSLMSLFKKSTDTGFFIG